MARAAASGALVGDRAPSRLLWRARRRRIELLRAPAGRRAPAPRREPFVVEEATIADIQKAITSKRLTATELVTLYLQRIKAYDGTCVHEPEGILGPISTIPHAGKIKPSPR